jgi:NADH-quinone oxidoreductase subunit N
MQDNPLIQVQPLLPDLILTSIAIALAFMDSSKRQGRQNYRMAVLALGGTLMSILATLHLFGEEGRYFFDMLTVDRFSLFIRLLFLLGTLLTILVSHNYWENEKVHLGEYYSLLLLANLGMNFMVSSDELLVVFLGLETLSVASYILLGIQKSNPKSTESALKYFLIGSFSSAFFLYGIAFTYGATQSTHLHQLVNQPHSFPDGNFLFLLASGLIVVGIGFKAAMVPFHLWTPDVYEGAPSPIAGFMSVGPKTAAFAFLIRWFVTVSASPQHQVWVPLWWIAAVLTMSWGNVAAVSQVNVKRLLAYSSIAQAGYLLVSITTGTPQSMAALLYYLVAYTFTNLGAFAIVSFLATGKEVFINLHDYAGLSSRKPFLAGCLTIFLLSLAGIPLTAGFTGKLLIFRAALESHLTGLVIIGVLNSAISVYYYSKIIVYMYMRENSQSDRMYLNTSWLRWTAGISLVGVIFLGVFPEFLVNWVKSSLPLWQ